MPAVSKAQNRAMQAAAAGNSTLGIPQSVGKEFAAATKSTKGLPERKGKGPKKRKARRKKRKMHKGFVPIHKHPNAAPPFKKGRIPHNKGKGKKNLRPTMEPPPAPAQMPVAPRRPISPQAESRNRVYRRARATQDR